MAPATGTTVDVEKLVDALDGAIVEEDGVTVEEVGETDTDEKGARTLGLTVDEEGLTVEEVGETTMI